MATRVVKDGESDLPREVFELDKDDRWQARLEEARARREVALAEKAAGKPPKKRLKPWEIEEVVPVKAIEPVVQARDSDRVDFADRVEAMRKSTKPEPKPTENAPDVPDVAASALKDPPKSHNWARLVEPEFPPPPPEADPAPDEDLPDVPKIEANRPPSADEFETILTTLARPRSSEKPANLVLPDAPDVKDLAERYASTMEPKVEDAPVVVEAMPEPELAAPTEPPLRKRPVLLASAAIMLALLTFLAEAPPVEKGPEMPPQANFAFQPALGVTWSLQEVPVQTQSGEWVPLASWSPVPPLMPSVSQAPFLTRQLPALSEPSTDETFAGLKWSPISPVRLGDGPSLFVPQLEFGVGTGVAVFPDLIIKRFGIANRTPELPRTEKLPDFANVPTSTRPPQVRPGSPDAAPEESSLTPPARLPGRPLKVTILRPTQSDRSVATTLAEDVSKLGHDLVRVQEVNHSIRSRNLRYFHEADRDVAEQLALAYDAELRDFTWFRPQPAVGTAELWLTGRSGVLRNPVASARRRVEPQALAPPEPQLVLPTPAPQAAEPRRSLIERIFFSHKRIGGVKDTGEGQGSRPTATGNTGVSIGSGSTNEGSGSETGADSETSDTGGTDTRAPSSDSGSDGGSDGATSESTGGDTGSNTGSSDSGTGSTSDSGSSTSSDTGTSGSNNSGRGNSGGRGNSNSNGNSDNDDSDDDD